MKIACDKCNALYEVDDRRIPPAGLTMKCPRCLSSFTVKAPAAAGGGLDFDSGWDVPLSAPPPAPPPPSPPTVGGSRYYLRRRTGKVFGPFLEKAIAAMLEQGKLDGDEELSLDGASWQPLSVVPGLAPFAKGRGSPSAAAAPGPDGGVDLPAPRGAIVPDVVDLPGLRGAKPPEVVDLPAPRGAAPARAIVPPAPAPSAARGFDLGEFDLGGPDDIADLPAPKSAAPPPPPAAARRSPLGEIADLPAPKGPAGIVDLPAPKALRATGLEYGQIDLGGDGGEEIPDLPQPRSAAPDARRAAPGIVDLPAPKRGMSPPAPGIVDLPAPKEGITDLLEPKEGLSGLPAPKDGLDFGQVELGGHGSASEEIGELDDLPVSAGKAIDLDLPAPKGAARPAAEEPDLLQPKAGEPPIVDVVAPKPAAVGEEGEEVVRFEPPPREALQAAGVEDVPYEVPVEAGGPEDVEAPAPRKRRVLFIGGSVAAIILVIGIVLGVATDYGFFGLSLLTGATGKKAAGKRQLAEAQTLLLKDTFQGYSLSAEGFVSAAKSLEVEEHRALAAQALAAIAVRFPPAPQQRTDADELLAKLAKAELKSPQVDKARALVALAAGQAREALGALKPISDREPGDSQAAVYLGWSQLAAGEPKEALASFNRALAASSSLPAALYGVAECQRALKDAGYEAAVDRVLRAAPAHSSALLRKAELHLAANRPPQAQPLLRQLLQLGAIAPVEMSATQAFLGEVAAREGQNRLARDLFGKSIQINTRNVVAQIGLAQLNYNARRFDEALVIYKRAQSLDPTDLRAATGLAATLIALGKPLDARKALQEIVRTAPDSPEVLYLQGLVDETVGNLDPAEAFYKATIKRSAIHFDAYHHLAAIYVKRAKHDEALKVLAQADSKIPSSPAVRTAQGEVLHAAKKLEQAQAKFEEALRLDANLNAAIFNLACVLIDRGKLSDGRDKLLALKAKDAEYPGLAAKLGDIHVRMKEYATAARAYDEALKVDATIEVRLSACRGYLLAGQHEKVLAQAAKVLELQPNSTAARALRAEARLAQARPDEALVEIRQALEREQKSEYSVVLGRVQEARGQKQEAIDAYTEALKGDPSLLEVRLRRGVLLVQTESVKEGQRELQAVLKANPGSAEAHYYVGVSLEDQRKEAQALAAYQAAVARDEKHAAAHFKIARLLSESPETKLKAVPHLAAAIKHAAPTEHWLPDAHFILGAIEEGRGQKKQALEAYKSYLCIAPPKAGARGEVEKRLRALGVEPREVECKPADKAAPPAKAEK